MIATKSQLILIFNDNKSVVFSVFQQE